MQEGFHVPGHGAPGLQRGNGRGSGTEGMPPAPAIRTDGGGAPETAGVRPYPARGEGAFSPSTVSGMRVLTVWRAR